VQELKPGNEQTERVSGLDRADIANVGTIAEQQACFDEWMKSLAPVYAPRAPPKSGHEHDEPIVEFGPIARLAGEYLVSDKPNIERVLRRSVGTKRKERGHPPVSPGISTPPLAFYAASGVGMRASTAASFSARRRRS
jgi:hypothetical protein